MLIVGVAPPEIEALQLRPSPQEYQLEVDTRSQIFVLTGQRDLVAQAIVVERDGQSVECRVGGGRLRDLLYLCG